MTQVLTDVLVLSARIDRDDGLRPSSALHSRDDIAAGPSHIVHVDHGPKRACDDLIRWRGAPMPADMAQACRRRRSKWDFVICQLASPPKHDAARRRLSPTVMLSIAHPQSEHGDDHARASRHLTSHSVVSLLRCEGLPARCPAFGRR